MHCKRTALAVLATMALAACATTTSPTGRSQYLAYSDSQLDQMGAQAARAIADTTAKAVHLPYFWRPPSPVTALETVSAFSS